MSHDEIVNDKELYGGFTQEEAKRYQEEARQRWGHTNAYKQSAERVKKMGPEGLKQAARTSGEILNQIASRMSLDPSSPEVQNLIAKHYDSLRAFYEPTLEIYRGLATMYVQDERFKKTFEDIAPGLAQFMSSAMIYFCDQKQK